MPDKLPSLGNTATERQGLNIVRDLVADMGFLFRDLPSQDFGIDGQLEIVDVSGDGGQHATGKIVSIQVKCGLSYFAHDDDTAWSVYLPESTVNYWRSHSVPVLLVIVDPTRRQAYWAQGDSTEHQATKKGFRITVSKLSVFDGASRDAIRELAEHTTAEGRRLARLEADLPLIATAVAGDPVVIDITHWHNKSSGRMDFWIGVPADSVSGSGSGDVRPFSSGSLIGTGGDPENAAKFLVPWAVPETDKDFESEKNDDLYREYLAETGTWDNEDQVYVDAGGDFDDWIRRRRGPGDLLPYEINAEVTRYRMRLMPNELAESYISLRKYLMPGSGPPLKWQPTDPNEYPPERAEDA
jgi:hypothetical protein